MKMCVRYVLPLTIAAMASACADITQNSQRAMYDIRGNIYSSAAKVQKWTEYAPPPSTPQAPQTRYCYYAMADVICYMEPQAHLSNKLVGVQGQSNSGYDYTYKAPTDPVQVTSITPDASTKTAATGDKDFPAAAPTPAQHPKGLLPQY